MAISTEEHENLKRLLLADQLDLVLMGIELVRSLDDEDLWDSLLTRVTYNKDCQYFISKHLFAETRYQQTLRSVALLLLIVRAPSDRLRKKAVALRLDQSLPSLPLEGFEAFPHLEELSLRLPDAPVDLTPLGACPSLRRLHLHGSTPVSLAGLGASRTLQRLEIYAPLETTAGIEGAPLDTLQIYSSVLQDLRGLEQTQLRELVVKQARSLDVSALGRCSKLETASLDVDRAQVGGMAGCPVKRLSLQGTLTDTLPTLPGLTSLTMYLSSRSAVQPELRTLHLEGQQGSTGQAIASAFPALTRLEVDGYKGDTEFLRGATSLETLLFRHCELTDIRALASLTGLKALGLGRLYAEDLEGLPSTRLVNREGKPTSSLDLAQSPVRSLRGLARLEGLQALDLSECLNLESLEGIEETGVMALDLRGCTALKDVSALGRLPELRGVALRGTSFHEHNVPEAAAAAVDLSSQFSLYLAMKQPRPVRAPAADIPVPEDQRAAWEGMVPLLAVVDRAGADRLMAFLSEHGTEEIVDWLLRGTTASDKAFVVRGLLTRADREMRDFLVQRIVGLGRGKYARRLIEARTRWVVYHEADLRGIGRFVNLERIEIKNATVLLGFEELALLKKLAHLELSGPFSDLSPLREATSLRELHLTPSQPLSLAPLQDHPSLQRVLLAPGARSLVTIPSDMTRLLG